MVWCELERRASPWIRSFWHLPTGRPPKRSLSSIRLQLADIYSVIGYYLRHRSEVEAYLGQRAHEAEQVRHQNEARFDTSGVRDRLLARRANPAPRAVRGSPPASPPQLALGSAKAAKGTEGYVEGDG